MVQVSKVRREGLLFAAKPDVMSSDEFEIIARSLARYDALDDAGRLIADKAAEARAGQEFLDLFGIEDARTWDPRVLWDTLTPERRYIAPLGKAANGGRPVMLNINEPALGGIGPHGLMVGMTGSGKSKHMRSIILGFAVTHPPEVLQFLLGDFKGEAEFNGFERLPHCVGVVSNLEDSAYKLNRFGEVVDGEIDIRQEMLKQAGFDSVTDYEFARSQGADLPPIGRLFIVLDELSELLKIRPDIGALFGRVGKQGRSLWISILVSSQQVESGKLEALYTQCSYAIGMKVNDAGESRKAINSPLAYDELKKAPAGSAILAVDGEYTKYRSYFTKAPFKPPRPKGNQTSLLEGFEVGPHRFSAAVTPLPDTVPDVGVMEEELAEADLEVNAGGEAPAVESVLLERIELVGRNRLPRALWLPSLDDTPQIPISELATELWGRPWNALTTDARLVVPIAREDDPRRHSQNVVTVDLAGPGGHVGIVGKTQSGKTMAVQTLMLALAQSHSPQRIQFYGLDFGGGKLSQMADLPHVAGIANASEAEKVERVIVEVEQLLLKRQREWGLHGVDIAEFRARKFGGGQAGPDFPDDGHGDVFLIIDNISGLQGVYYDLHDRVTKLIESALNYGIHLIVTNDNWLRLKVADKLGTKLELCLANPVESKCRIRDQAKEVPTNQPGRGLQLNGLHMRIAAPLDKPMGDLTSDAEGAAVRAAAAAVSAGWQARDYRRTCSLRVLPAMVSYDDLPPAPPRTLKLGMGQNSLSTVALDIGRAPHFVAAGRGESGRTTLLRTLLRSITETFDAPDRANPSFDQAQIFLLEFEDYQLIDAVDERYRAGYACGPKDAAALCEELARKARLRRPPADLPEAQKRNWRPNSPRWFVVVDDFNLLTHSQVAGQQRSALSPLVEAIPRGRSIGLHVLAATTADDWYRTGQSNKVISEMQTAGLTALIMDSSNKERYFEDIKGAARVAGRGELWNRKTGRELVQVAMPHEESAS
ncbi:type VII secretion protein EccCb [Mycolicibacterium goodii]|uniref:type VII secretion protein EccCb n=1 Tax=Mycolicibacterium goodii TaxID=134601 RepID=UPI001BDCD338|nr:type VII secretion protein EccCb [Mycolicibacterium goodii]MBU8819276.1 type VII secretion protein EccCb [Mycolicibacterium goodii]